ncbi:LysR family transcriptional regulator [Phreatobacter stygius]|uniref:LysR family transcriptional regulator n=1 Tax=Phreatobacter stygius TaxID=1940610 RepID=UPI001FE7267E|nr:LysR family transcriptional regulator [Phreatobacter stygius]
MDLRKLRYFAAVARAGSFSRAAEDLRIAQPALSRRVRELEDELGKPLLVRHGRGVRLSATGAVILQRAEEIDHLVAQLRIDADDGAEAMRGSISLGVPPVAGLLMVPAVVARFAAARPDVALHVREGISSLIHEWLGEQRIDVGVVYNPLPVEGTHVVPVLRERMVLVGPPDGGDAAPLPLEIRIRDLADLPLIMPSLPHNNRRVLEQAAAQHGIRLRIRSEVDSVALTKALVGAGRGYTMLTYASVHDAVMRGELTARRLDRPPIVATLAIAMRKDRRTAPLARELSATLTSVMAELVASGGWRGARVLSASAEAPPDW